MLVTQSCQTLCNPMDCSPPGSSVQGIFQVRILGWVESGLLCPPPGDPPDPRIKPTSLSLFLSLTKNIYLFIYLFTFCKF